MNSVHEARYKRQLMMPEIGEGGQDRLAHSRVVVVGAGGLGSPALLYLAAAGVGDITIMDFDKVEASNLNRQLLHNTLDIGRTKVDSAADALHQLNPELALHTQCIQVSAENVGMLVEDADLVVDAVDSFGAKLIINDGCVATQTPFVHAGASGLKGQLYLYIPGSACLRCFFPSVPDGMEKPQERGILGATAGVIGTMQALLAIRFLVSPQDCSENQLIAFNGQEMRQQLIRVNRNDDCLGCGVR